VWLFSNAALALSIQTLNGLDKTPQYIKGCLEASGFDPINGAQVIPINGTCIEMALRHDQDHLQDKQQVYFKYLLWATFGLSAVRFLGVSLGLTTCHQVEHDAWKLTRSACTTG
jgi:chitin synthase